MIVSLAPIARELVEFVEKKTGETIKVCHGVKEAESVLSRAEIVIDLMDAETLDKCTGLKWMFQLRAGVEKLPFGKLKAKGVIVSNSRGIHKTQMAEHTIGIMIAFSRGIASAIKNQQKKKYDKRIHIDELTGKTLCIIGAGNIGREIARKAKAFDMKVIGVKKHVETLEHFDEVLDMGRLGEALEQADYTVLITPLTDETYHLIGKEEFQRMKPDSIFINISRGDTVDEEALIEALHSGTIAGAGLDVFHIEPLPENSPLWEMDNVIITPHNSGNSPHYMKRAMEVFADSLLSYRKGEPLPNVVDLDMKY